MTVDLASCYLTLPDRTVKVEAGPHEVWDVSGIYKHPVEPAVDTDTVVTDVTVDAVAPTHQAFRELLARAAKPMSPNEPESKAGCGAL